MGGLPRGPSTLLSFGNLLWWYSYISTYILSFRSLPFMGKLLGVNLVLCTCLVHLSFIFWKSSLVVQLLVHVYLSIIFLKFSKTNVHCPLAERCVSRVPL
jgi:hypothetical protein